ncbi:hypothetical protein PUNSTDRAFT_108565 [Punctularia strigosozonata HHB-11173 SS5]|uniref:Uncharacterized protein n=1 Tax=Punctularia strigosozonata (strain HHB-11173) TaxID=741275 RepID=R7S1I0_PUNST|nr:uncharacterized protein PUNSTDRAFT_108565 [Punctularia strigosozonata HHB-11173 SS5]EIN04083.1 hypothetical protein PUNSTDRAFT_108565 [Punctularia strigosozonata HHB-11173 SS5]
MGRKQKKRSASSKSALVSGSEYSHDEEALASGRKEGKFLNRVRRISLVGRHKSSKSISTHRDAPEDRNARVSLTDPRERVGQIPMMPASQLKTPEQKEQLLPPIELQPPSPPDRNSERSRLTASSSEPAPSVSFEAFGTDPIHNTTQRAKSPMSIIKAPGSPTHYASLGRSTPVSAITGTASNVPRRNSLGDLKIPARISQAQVGLRRDLGMVREFAASVEALKSLQDAYRALVREVQAILETPESPSRATSPTTGFRIGRRRARSNANPPTAPEQTHKELANAFGTIDSKYRIAWECAELLIELGGGPPAPAAAPPSSVSAPADMHAHAQGQAATDGQKKGRERAITLAGDDRGSKPPTPTFNGPPAAIVPPPSWRASTGRHDLSQRQLLLLRDMLQSSEGSSLSPPISSTPVMEEPVVNRAWRWGDAMNSTITLPSEEGNSVSVPSPLRKQRSHRLGMRGFRDMLKSLRKGVVEHQHQQPTLPLPSPEHIRDHAQLPGRRRAKTSSGPDTVHSNSLRSPYGTQVSLSNHKSSPRRPSLASIFRLGQRSKSNAGGGSSDNMASTRSASSHSAQASTSSEEEDWDRMDSASDMDTAAEALHMSGDGTGTVKMMSHGKRPRRPPILVPTGSGSRTDVSSEGAAKSGRSASTTPVSAMASASRSSIWDESQSSHHSQGQARTTRLSNVDERDEHDRERRGLTPRKPKSKARPGTEPVPSLPSHSGSVRSVPPPSAHSADNVGFALAMTPENIKPLLDNAREVQARLQDCVGEVKTLLQARNQRPS